LSFGVKRVVVTFHSLRHRKQNKKQQHKGRALARDGDISGALLFSFFLEGV
jgi:hypothetical protein